MTSLEVRSQALLDNQPVPMASLLESFGNHFWRAWRPSVSEARQCLPDPLATFVPRGFGAPSGLSHLEHFHWGRLQEHPPANLRISMSEEVRAAVTYEIAHALGLLHNEYDANLITDPQSAEDYENYPAKQSYFTPDDRYIEWTYNNYFYPQ